MKPSLDKETASPGDDEMIPFDKKKITKGHEQKQVTGFKDKSIPSYKSKIDIRKKQALFEKAIKDFLDGESSSLRRSAKKFGIAHSTLHRVFVSRGEFTGSGNHSRVFTRKEEENIAKIALENSDNGEKLTWSNLREIMLAEIDRIKSQDPSRDMFRVSSTMGSFVNRSFVRRFAERNGLSACLIKTSWG